MVYIVCIYINPKRIYHEIVIFRQKQLFLPSRYRPSKFRLNDPSFSLTITSFCTINVTSQNIVFWSKKFFSQKSTVNSFTGAYLLDPEKFSTSMIFKVTCYYKSLILVKETFLVCCAFVKYRRWVFFLSPTR